MAKKQSVQKVINSPPLMVFAVHSQTIKDKVIRYLEEEKKLDKVNHQMMLNCVDLTILTKAKIGALGKLGKQYEKASSALIKKYNLTKVNSTIGSKHKWIG